ncbi:MAG: methyltransferase [Archaeoglobaceae archaeon]|nr:methyltransferase [Archaeoglobaceae archaeon]MDW7990151.1 methyltransferase [Archaeoglobaceae archaeon]
MIYEPSEDSELLLETALQEVKEEDTVIEIGAGSGFVSEKLIRKCSFLITTDISPFATKNLRKKGLNVIRTDIAKGIKKKFSLVLFNPPYLELEEEIKRDFWEDCTVHGGREGIEVICRFLDTLKDFMERKGRAILIVSSINCSRVFEEIHKRGYIFEIISEKGLFFEKLYAIRISLQE